MSRPSLNRALLGAPLPSDVAMPTYDRSATRIGIVHVGVGGFHRAHQAVYVDDLMTKGLAMDWAICGVGVLPTDRRMADVMSAQDCLYTVVVRDSSQAPTARIVGSMARYLFAPDDPEAVVQQMT